MSSDKDKQPQPVALTPLEEKTIDFYGDSITAALVQAGPEGEEVAVPLRPICEYLGLDWSSQRKRIYRDEVLADEILSVVMTTTETGQGKGRREVLSRFRQGPKQRG